VGRRWVLLALVGIVLVAAVAAAVARAGEQALTPQPISIGALFSLTGSGDVYGPQQVKGAQLAVDQINAQGGIDGAKLRLVVRNDKSDTATGKTQMRDLIDKTGAVAVLGPTLSAVAYAADPVADSLQTPVLGVSNTGSGIVGECAYACTWIWRDSLGESIAVPANVSEYVLEAHPSTAAIVYASGDVLGIQEAQLAGQALLQNGVRVLRKTALPKTGSIDAAVKRAIAGNPAVLFIGTVDGQTAADVMKAARNDNFLGTFLGGNTMNSNATAALAGDAGQGARSASAWYIDNDFPANAAFVTAYSQTYGTQPDQFATQAYIGVTIIANALTSAHVGASTKPIATKRAALQHALPNVALLTPIGPFRFTADHDVSQIVWVLSMNGQGGHQLAGFCDPQC
jgi:branched-chain amino acid transport system substrate-binding protein